MTVRGMGVTGVEAHVDVTHNYVVFRCFHGAVLGHRFAAQHDRRRWEHLTWLTFGMVIEK